MQGARNPEEGAVHRSTAALTQDERNAADGRFSTGWDNKNDMNYTHLALLAFLALLPMSVTFWAIFHVLTMARFENPMTRFKWLGVITFLPVVGALIYFVAGRKRKVSAER